MDSRSRSLACGLGALPACPAAPASVPSSSPPTPLTGIRNKLSAGDLLSAESILEVWRAQHGEDSLYLVGLSWLARGALLMDDLGKAKRYAAEVEISFDTPDREDEPGLVTEIKAWRRVATPRQLRCGSAGSGWALSRRFCLSTGRWGRNIT